MAASLSGTSRDGLDQNPKTTCPRHGLGLGEGFRVSGFGDHRSRCAPAALWRVCSIAASTSSRSCRRCSHRRAKSSPNDGWRAAAIESPSKARSIRSEARSSSSMRARVRRATLGQALACDGSRARHTRIPRTTTSRRNLAADGPHLGGRRGTSSAHHGGAPMADEQEETPIEPPP
jgi:hypothetical protein